MLAVLDGDTLTVRLRVRTRKSAPELGSSQGEAAALQMQKDFPPGTAVQVQPVAVDPYGRLVAIVSPGGEGGDYRGG